MPTKPKPTYEELQDLATKLGKETYLCLQREKSLMESEGKFRRLTENIKEEYFFYAHDTDGVFFYVSPSIINVLGYTPDEFLTDFTKYLTDNPINNEVINHTNLSIRGKQQPSYEVEVYHKDGSIHRLEVTEFPLLNKQGRVMAVEGIAHDITHRVQAEEAIKKSHDELEKHVTQRTAQLLEANNELKREIEERKRAEYELKEKQRQIEKDLNVAAKIQKSLIPEFSPNLGTIRIAWLFEPCVQVGGDIFNFYYPNENQISFYMLDACGHGVSAALIAAAASQFLHNPYETDISRPDVVLNRLDRVFPFERFESFFTISYVNIDYTKGRLTYSNAGHPPPILLHADGGLEILDYRGPIIGLGNGKPFGQDEKRLEPGDKIILYTDGILDHINGKGERFGKKRLYEAVQKNSRQAIEQMVEFIRSMLFNFANAEQSKDDISVLMIEYVGNRT